MKYGYFLVGDIFPKNKKIRKFSSIPDSIGTIPFVSSSAMNNGVTAFVDEISFTGNCISVSTNGKCFDSFYHEGSIAISTDVEILTNENLNEYNALYICSILNLEAFKWCYGRKPKNDKVFKSKIRLPIDDDGKPAWKLMEIYIKQFTQKEYSFGTIDKCLMTNNTKPNILKKINSKYRVKLFKFASLLSNPDKDLYKAKAYAKVDLDVTDIKKPGYLPFVSRTENNNAIDCYVKYDDSLTIEKGNCIIIGDTTATIFYQDSNFVTGDHIIVIRANWINKYTALYIKTLLDKERYRYSYGRAFKKDFVLNTILALPVDDNDNPDWKYMENYIKSLPYADRI